jgi:transcriptional regulator with XRE-family HTH domain
MNNLDRIRKGLSPERRRKITTRANEIMAEEMTLREVRKAVDRTQIQVAKVLGINQDGVSRLEQRADLLLSTLRSYLKAIGGELKLVVKLPNQRTVILSGISGIGARGKSGQPKKKTIVDLSPSVTVKKHRAANAKG